MLPFVYMILTKCSASDQAKETTRPTKEIPPSEEKEEGPKVRSPKAEQAQSPEPQKENREIKEEKESPTATKVQTDQPASSVRPSGTSDKMFDKGSDPVQSLPGPSSKDNASTPEPRRPAVLRPMKPRDVIKRFMDSGTEESAAASAALAKSINAGKEPSEDQVDNPPADEKTMGDLINEITELPGYIVMVRAFYSVLQPTS